jgi:enoyl-CoA hydratase
MPVKVEFRDEFAILVLDRQEALNALSFDILDEISAALDKVGASSARAILVTGAGDKAFCAGADIKELIGRDWMSNKRGAEFGQGVFARFARLPMASVAVINGYAFGGGLELALACTFRVAAPAAKLGLPEIKLGLIPGYGGTQRLPRIVGEARALEMILTGRTVDAAEAERIGLVNRVIEGDPLEAGIAFAREFTRHSLPALALARDAVTRALDLPIAEGLKIEADLSTIAFGSRDAAEGLQAFLDKRRPDFKDA